MLALATWTLWVTAYGGGETLRYSHLNLPLHGTVCKGKLYGFFGEKKSDASIYAIPLSDFTRKQWKNYGADFGEIHFHYRHNIKNGSLWFAAGPEGINRIPFDELHFFDSSNERRVEQLKKKFRLSDEHEPTHSFGSAAFWQRYRSIQAGEVGPPGPVGGGPAQGIAGIGFVPTSEFTCKIFFFSKKEKKIQTWETYARYDAKKDKWEIADERNPEIFASIFVEDFYVFIQKNDYYFVTQSGKLFHAPPPKAGEKSRTMKSLWKGDNFPIVAIIEDADNDKVWLFTKARKKLEPDGVFFEMATEIRQQDFDHSKLKPVNVEGRARPLLEYLPLIRADKKKEGK